MLNATRQIQFGGLGITEQLIKLLMEQNQSFITNSDMKYAEKIKETHFKVNCITSIKF